MKQHLLSFAIAVVIVFLAFCACVMTTHGSPPDPWVRMTSPSGCSGGVFHASREYGIWIATCKHCVNRSGRVRLVFFQDGQRAKVDGEFVRAHRRYDCSIVWVSADKFYELPTAVPLADGDVGPFAGQAVYAVGSYAGGTVTPAARHVAISRVDRGAYQFRLNDYAWGGHSGGPVVDAASGRMLGVLWGTSGRSSLVTSNRALLETLYGTWTSTQLAPEPEQGFYSVHDDVDAKNIELTNILPRKGLRCLALKDAKPVARKPEIDVHANRSDLNRIRRDVDASHFLRDHFDWDWDTDRYRSTPRIEWRVNGRKKYTDRWYGVDGFIEQYRQTGGQYY